MVLKYECKGMLPVSIATYQSQSINVNDSCHFLNWDKALLF
jgi:hypothetical protein